MKKIFQFIILIIVTCLCFFYTEKAVILARNVDPVMKKIRKEEKNKIIREIKPVIKNDEVILGLNGCIIDEDSSYNNMKKVKEYDENLLVMKEIKNKNVTNKKYIVSANKKNKNIALIIILNDSTNLELIEYLKSENVLVNYFIDGYFLENNLEYIKSLKRNANLYNYGRNKRYNDKNIIYDNNLIESISNNESNYCLVKNKNKKYLKECNKYSMNVIKGKYIKDYNELKEKLENGDIIILESNDIENIKVSIKYILSKGYNIKKLNDLLDQKNNCK